MCTATMFIIPINIAAIRGKYVLMNVCMFLTFTSWAHHGITHELSRLGSTYSMTTYNKIDVFMCRVAIAYSLMYALMCTSRLQCVVYLICLMSVVYSYYAHVEHNKNYYRRDIENWGFHKAHMVMHLSTCIGFTVIAL